MNVVSNIFSDIKKLDFASLLEIQAAVSQHVEAVGVKGQLEQRAANLKKAHCHHCGCVGRFQKWGTSRSGTVRIRCIDCKKTFSATSGTPFYRLRFRGEWLRYLQTMSVHISLAKLRENFGFDHPCDTLLRWRHRFLRFMEPNPTTSLAGVIQVDETYFRKCYKGHKDWVNGGEIDGRPARKRGGASKRGLSNEQVPVLTAIDSGNYIFQQALSNRRKSSIRNAMNHWVREQSVICSDGNSVYEDIAVTSNRGYVLVKLKKRGPSPQLNLAKINAYHTNLKDLINRDCRGVNTQYLPLYLGWMRRCTQAAGFGKVVLREMLGLAAQPIPRQSM